MQTATIRHVLNRKQAVTRAHNEPSADEKKLIFILGLPAFGLSLAITVVVTYVPLLAKQFSVSNTIVGLIIAIEGIAALILPVVIGGISDHLHTRIGGRLPFMVAGLPICALALGFIGFSNSLTILIPLVAIFFIAYYIAYEPYRALYPDLVKDEASGRSQSTQAMWRGLGTFIALGVGGFLFVANNWLPFIAAVVFVVLSSAVFFVFLFDHEGVPRQNHRKPDTIRASYVSIFRLLKRHKMLRNFVVANILWELSLAALKSFIFLYLTIGLGKSKAIAALLVTCAALVIFAATPFVGKMADTFGKVQIVEIAAALFGIGLLIPGLTTTAWVILAILPVGALSGAVVLSLPYALLMPMMPKEEHGRLTGLYSTSRGIGIMLGPILAGSAISLSHAVLPAKGYSAMWLVCGVTMLLSVPFTRAIPNELYAMKSVKD